MGVGAFNANLTGGGADTAFLMLRSLSPTILSSVIAVAICNSNLLRQPYPFGDMLVALKGGKLGA